MYNMLGRLVMLIVKVPEEMLGTLYDLVEKLISRDGQMWLDGLKKFLRKDPCWVVATKTTQAVKIYLSRLFVFNLGATDGKDTYATAHKVFKAYFDPGFKKKGIVFSGVAPKMKMVADELTLDGKLTNFLGNTATELEKRRLLGSQFLTLFRNYSDTPLGRDLRICASLVVLTAEDKPVAEDLSNVFVAYVFQRAGDEFQEFHAHLIHVLDDEVKRVDDQYCVFSPKSAI